ncbi:MAG: hypothetical protein LBJ25_03770, partial [Candidatus Margulisbacteria bacterium]|nr:hypothetical protein [Candidatus Margulisiibacteriota bacterium]
MSTKRLPGLLVLGLVLQLAVLWSALNDPPLLINNTFVPPSEAFIGEWVTVKAFSVHGNASPVYIRLSNAYASDLPFSDDGIEQVELRSGVMPDGSGGMPVGTGRSIDGGSAYWIQFANSATTTDYAVRYKISPTAKYSLTGGTKVVVNAKIDTIQEGNNEAVQVSDGTIHDIEIKANGLVYKPGSLKNMLPGTSSGVPPGVIASIMQFTLRAESSDVGVKSINLGSASNFATSEQNRGDHVQRIVLLADDGDGDYSGMDRETIVCDTGVLPYNGNTKEDIYLPFNQTITLSAYNVSNGVPNTRYSERIFYVLYELGPGFPAGQTLTCQLLGAGGVLSSGENSSLAQPTGNSITITGRLADAWLISSTALVNAPTTVVAGQRGIKMIDFSYSVPDTGATINNVAIEITNGGGTFRQRFDNGIRRLLLYKYPPVNSGQQTPTLTGEGEVIDTTKAVFRNQTLVRGDNQYYVVYDVGVQVSINMSAQAQVTGISVSSNSRNSNANASFWSPAAPPGPAYVSMYPNRALIGPLRVTDEQDNDISSIGPGQSFKVYVPIYNEYERVDLPPGVVGRSMEVFFQPSGNQESTRPVFYSGSDFNSPSTERQDISHEFTWTVESLFGNTLNVNLIYNIPLVVTFNVTASNLKTSGPVYVDAQVIYNVYTENNAYMYNDPAAPPASYHAYYDNTGYFRSAAAGLGGGTVPLPSIAGYVTLQANGSGSSRPASLWPKYILPGGVNFANADVSVNPFVNGDEIPLNSSLTISLNAEMEAHLNYDFEISQNGVRLDKYTDWFLLPEGPVIFLPARNFSVLSAGTAGVLRIAPVNTVNINDDNIPETIIRYTLLSGGTLEIKEILPYPSPYDPDAGSLYVGFKNSSMDSGT